MKIKIINVTIISFFICTSAKAGDVEDNMNSFWGNLGGNVNYTKGGAYKTQTSTYYSGPSIYARSKVVNLAPITIQTPRLRAGCAGIDAFTGSFSHINADQFIDLLKNVTNNAKGFIFQLAMDTMSPTISNNIKGILSSIEKINAMNINSCDIAVGAVGAVTSTFNAASNEFCKRAQSMNNWATDWAKARNNCGAGGETSKTLSSITDLTEKEALPDNINFAWRALKKKNVTGELAELFQTFSGTIIKKRPTTDNAPIDVIIYPAKADDKDLIDKLLIGGKFKIYKCDEPENCLNITETDIDIKTSSALKAKIKALLDSITKKIRSNGATLTLDEQELVDKVATISIISMIKVNVLNAGEESAISENEGLANTVGVDLILYYMQEIFSLIGKGMEGVIAGDKEGIKNFLLKLQNISQVIDRRKAENTEKVKLSNVYLEKIHNIEKVLSASSKSILNDLED